ncbi:MULTISPECIES: ABC-three component system protein [unclassified Pseudoalteromonas]|uniref:ABC-three component system protein n=1 Tax=unclassified Pseudoalteromonas TaxID=194690 RepID=UPI0015D506AA|nr:MULTISPECIES: ABC-three component system protein [unclassified Pseudoalteromonas]MDP2636744.1 trypsin-like peptidase domain-containing protein [Pseudoalteromonas sp. 1_MG-2023]
MSEEEIIQRHTVKVNHGSGVVMQPSSGNFSYVFTAKHCIQESEGNDKPVLTADKITVRKLVAQGEVASDEVLVLERYYCNDKDVAILKVSTQSVGMINVCKNELELGEELYLWGFPGYAEEQEKTLADEIKSLALKVHRREQLFYEFRNESFGELQEIEGYSGGGIFRIRESEIYLAAIENRMADGEAHHQHIAGLPIKLFMNLLCENDLPSISAPHMHNIAAVKGKIFNFNSIDPTNLIKAKAKLGQIAQSYISKGITRPEEIINELKGSLQIPRRGKDELESEHLWVALLELITLKHLVDKSEERKLGILELNNLFESVRLIFINSKESWRRFTHYILYTDLSQLKKDGIALLVLIGAEDLPDEPVLDTRCFSHFQHNISSAIEEHPYLIDVVEKSPILTGEVKVVHLAKLHRKCFLDNEFELRDLDSNAAIAFLSDKYSNYIPKSELKNA